MPECPNCGEPVHADATQCPVCGAGLASQPPDRGSSDPAASAEPSGSEPRQSAPRNRRTEQPTTGRLGRRNLLKLGAGGVVVAGLAGAGWLALQGGSERASGGQSLSSLADWLPAPGEVGRDHPGSFFYLDASQAGEQYLQETTAQLFEQTASIGSDRHVVKADQVAVGPSRTVVATGSFDAESVRSALRKSMQEPVERGSFSVYGNERRALAVGDDKLVAGRRTVGSNAREGVEAVIDAGRGVVNRYREHHPGAAALIETLDGSDYVAAHPIADAPSTAPEQGLFHREQGFGVGASLGETVELTTVRTFDGEVPTDAIESWLQRGPYTGAPDPTIETDGSTALVSGSLDSTELTLQYFSGACREVDRADADVDGEIVVDVIATKFFYEFSSQGRTTSNSLRLPVDTPVTFRMTSSDVIHGIDIEGTPVDQLLVPGEVTTATVRFTDPGSREISCSWYCGRGHAAMEGQIEVFDPGKRTFGGWLDGAEGYEGTVIDKRGQGEVTVKIGTDDYGFAFSPVAVQVDPGTTVTWEWTGEGGGHNVVFENADIRSGAPVSETGHTFEYTFETDGIYKYHCLPHDAVGQRGVVVVGDEPLN